ncbi:hypothetical protein LX32DRAFT_733371 [Colletotrichum zoysiae]|uniref:Reverse transcriptase domain-containing protein n=1 Tax=Colletotrichum zoysiae TaxID=1216348 RepID=A0AAD9H3C1_9PEZI|nr:hypothetical protein LX32DRAFT_733371 [Colletotrichum zoysiae]
MSHPTSVLSKTLQSITVTKIRELEKRRAQYESRKSNILQDADRHLSQGERIACLLRGVKELYYGNGYNVYSSGVDNIDSLLAQSKYDASVPPHMLQSAEDLLRSNLDVQSHKLSMAHLYSSLVTEWMSPGDPMEGTAAAALAEEESSFEVVDRQKERLQNLCDQFENIVFTPLETDEAEIDKYLHGFFDTEDKEEILNNLRLSIRTDSESMLRSLKPFNENMIKQCIKGLLEQDLLSDEKQTILKEFEQNEMVLEIADVLNTRFNDFESWSWDAGEGGVPVLPRQQLNGKYRIWMDEDVLQAIFIHYVCITSCVKVKTLLRNMVSDESYNFWRWHAGPAMTERGAQRRAYYLDEWSADVPSRRHFTPRRNNEKTRARSASLDAAVRVNGLDSIAKRRREDYVDNFCVAALPGQVDSLNNGLYADEGEQSGDSDDDYEEGWGGERASSSKPNIKQFLLRTLATEVMIQQAFNGQAAVVQSDLKWFGASLSHTSIFAVMRFFGFPDNLIAFYKKVLEAPLNLGPSSESLSANKPRDRRRGMPMARAPEKLIGELVLFVMDLAVNQETGLQLYRLHDDLWVAGAPADTAKAWAAMQRFARVMGLEFNTKKTGSVYLTRDGLQRDEAIAAELPDGKVSVGHLMLDPRSGKWAIDQEKVAEHVAQLKKQLAESRSVLDWVRTWNSCISRFFGHTFGEPAFCFGKEHVESVLETYQKMQRDIFAPWCNAVGGGEADGSCSAVRYIKCKIEERFGVSDVSDAFILFPDQLGGLGLRNPFVHLLMTQERLGEKGCAPAEMIDDLTGKEREDYELGKKEFEALRDSEARGEAQRPLRPRRRPPPRGCGRVHELRGTTPLRTDREVDSATEVLKIRPLDMLTETRWVVQMYHKEAMARYGDLRLVEGRFLPLGVIAMMRKKAVRWGLVL